MPLHKYPPKIWEVLKLQKGIYARLPQHYLRSLQDTTPPTPVHWKPLGVKYRLDPKTGHRERVQDVPVPVYYPPESQDGLWGGEGWISGFRYAKDDKLSTRLRKTWKPQLFNRELYSEILDQKFTVTVTARTLDLIDAAFGFDFYILKQTPKQDLNSKFGMDLKRAMLLRLARKDTDLYTDDTSRREKIYNRYKQQFEIPEEEAEWMGLSLEEAVEKRRLLEKKDPEPLHNSLVKKLVEELTIKKLSEPQIVEKK
ncbi:39S ribosomal protein L28, mitochondrial-like isoform X1 [Sinocyclocheilus grahami]|uniref:39S ribosomal protein L28, mitochondrial-like isoform X1 n=1 Tax=Sinocyclocheilus grahami TaxID=75366 RepID=UPI0007AC5DB5|nr:PREDICTED: 39S ribosomal protein L28, mitochondrial-like isoform X1 [Sinocyclocheilus grahami]XP_016092217.1 PREDICTED: 39S ribosomal protein L28, mitochondrial-like isoform X1 [Sinocyclocheilus grahami]